MVERFELSKAKSRDRQNLPSVSWWSRTWCADSFVIEPISRLSRRLSASQCAVFWLQPRKRAFHQWHFHVLLRSTRTLKPAKGKTCFFFLSNHRVISMEAATALQSSTPRRYFTVPIILQAWTNHDRRDKRTSLFLKSEQSFIFTSEYPNPNFHKVHLAKENEQWMAFIRKNTENIFKSRCQRRFSG